MVVDHSMVEYYKSEDINTYIFTIMNMVSIYCKLHNCYADGSLMDHSIQMKPHDISLNMIFGNKILEYCNTKPENSDFVFTVCIGVLLHKCEQMLHDSLDQNYNQTV